MDEKFNIGNSEEIKRCPLKLALFGEYVYKVLEIIAKFDELNFVTEIFLTRVEIMPKGKNEKFL